MSVKIASNELQKKQTKQNKKTKKQKKTKPNNNNIESPFHLAFLEMSKKKCL
jgi:hypothetical protein